MEGVKAKATAATGAELSSTEHVTGNWFSVPELRLRDHRFSVPLDYSLDHATSPKISIFAREVVAGGKYDFFVLQCWSNANAICS
ncbi:hypothetical protein M9H77_33195 [Catharanthus roseus]|uniref:Uncharacterized protein n=1 Tax=Catharanthus roseus TaxID=4058 RepID=A0ACB9ZIM4_CATRO|nr:hypothetical protein M9H77_33195 [Catharanthus roseus]